jgi:hypothetical protein
MRGLTRQTSSDGYYHFSHDKAFRALLDVADWLGFDVKSGGLVAYFEALEAEGPDILRRAK